MNLTYFGSIVVNNFYKNRKLINVIGFNSVYESSTDQHYAVLYSDLFDIGKFSYPDYWFHKVLDDEKYKDCFILTLDGYYLILDKYDELFEFMRPNQYKCKADKN